MRRSRSSVVEADAERWNIAREEMEQFALTSHQRAFAAIGRTLRQRDHRCR
jgi:acetyl-CoA acetyltransferase